MDLVYKEEKSMISQQPFISSNYTYPAHFQPDFDGVQAPTDVISFALKGDVDFVKIRLQVLSQCNRCME